MALMKRTCLYPVIHSSFTIVLFSVLHFSFSIHCYAQDDAPSVKLSDVEVQAARVVSKVDGLMYFPTKEVLRSSSTIYDLLARLSLPGIRINEVAHTLSSFNGRGEVQIRIDDRVVSRAEMLALDPQRIKYIEYIDHPGVRYGDGVSCVILIVTRWDDHGLVVGLDATQALTAPFGQGMAYGSRNRGKGELFLSYDFDYACVTEALNSEVADYTFTDGSIHTVSRRDVEQLCRRQGHEVQLKYSRADSGQYVFQAAFRTALQRVPEDWRRREISDEKGVSSFCTESTSHSFSPVLDLYYLRHLGADQTLTVNAVGTSIATRSTFRDEEGVPYAYTVEGQTRSLLGEALYEYRLPAATFTAGLDYKWKQTDNCYKGDLSAFCPMHSESFYLFSEANGSYRQLRYRAGLGVEQIGYRQGLHDYSFWLFRPQAGLAYNLTNAFQLKYAFSIGSHISKIAMISDAMVRTNSMEWTLGNPDILPNRETEQTLTFSYTADRLQAILQSFYRACRRPNMAVYERTTDNQFIYTQRNQPAIDLLYVNASVSYQVVPQTLMLSAYGGPVRCFNYGDHYTHCYTAWYGTLSASAYLGAFTLSAYGDNGWRFLEGESKGINGYQLSIRGAYTHRSFTVALTAQQPFARQYATFRSELLNQFIHKHSVATDRDQASLLSLSVTWRLAQGQRFPAAERTVHLSDTDAGILK